MKIPICRVHEELLGGRNDGMGIVAQFLPLGQGDPRVTSVIAKAVHHNVIVAFKAGQGWLGDQNASSPTVIVEDDIVLKLVAGVTGVSAPSEAWCILMAQRPSAATIMELFRTRLSREPVPPSIW